MLVIKFEPNNPTGPTPDFLTELAFRTLNKGISFFKSKLTNKIKSETLILH